MRDREKPGILALSGPKHAGKSSCGRILASLCGGIFIDLDEYIALISGKSPRELYREGPESFRHSEAEALKRILDGQLHESMNSGPCVIALGGGIIDNPEAMAMLNKDIFLVYLELSADEAWRRVKASAEKDGEFPPFLQTQDPRETHRKLHERRGQAYKRHAHYTVSAEGKKPEEIGDEIKKIWKNFPYLD